MPLIVIVLAWVTDGVDDFDGGLGDTGGCFKVELVDKTRLRSPGGSDYFVAYARRLAFSLAGDVVSSTLGLKSKYSSFDVFDDVLLSLNVSVC